MLDLKRVVTSIMIQEEHPNFGLLSQKIEKLLQLVDKKRNDLIELFHIASGRPKPTKGVFKVSDMESYQGLQEGIDQSPISSSNAFSHMESVVCDVLTMLKAGALEHPWNGSGAIHVDRIPE